MGLCQDSINGNVASINMQSKGQSKQGTYKTGAVGNSSLRVSKALYYCPAQTKVAYFLRSYVSSAVIVKYSLINLL